MKKLLFISHQSSRTGAPLVLLYFLKWLKQNKKEIEKISLLSLETGSLSKEFEIFADEYFELELFRQKESGLKKKILNRILFKFLKKANIDPREKLLQKLAAQNYDVIFSNTTVSFPIGKKIKEMNTRSKLVVHVHELGTIMKMYRTDFGSTNSPVDRFIAASNLVKRNLIENYNIPDRKIKIVNEFSPLPGELRKKKDRSDFIVGASGFAHWRKGHDLFIQVAKYIQVKYSALKIKFIWVGGISIKEKILIEADIEKAGLTESVDFVGEKENPEEFFVDFDVFLLTSREDPFPLVCLEVGMMGKPIICFEHATGISEVLSKGGGVIVPYLDVPSMAEEVVSYLKNPEKRKRDGEVNIKNFSEFTPENLCPLLYENIHEIL